MDGDEEDPYLPFELITLILLRLPVKSLLRFKCVCKSWFSLISHSHFTNSHYELNSETHTRRILLITPNFESRSIEFEASLNDDSASYSPDISFLLDDGDDFSSSTSSDMDRDLSTHPRDVEIQGSCRGFIFLTSSSTSYMDFSLPRILFKLDFKGSCRGFILLNCHSSLCIWNPSTGVHKQIPFTNIDTNPKANYFYGFGYDPSTDDYLVLSMSYDPDRDDMLSHLGIFSLRANVWSEIEGGNLLPYSQDSVLSLVEVLLNGAIHWMAFRHDISMSVIVGFHLTERKLLELRLPNEIIYGPSTVYDFWVFRGCLSLWDMWNDKGTIEIWVMTKYSVQSSWTKTLVLSLARIPTHFFCPKCYTKSGDIVGTDSANALAKYNDKGHLIEHRSYCKNTYGSLVVMYTESMLSLPGADSDQA